LSMLSWLLYIWCKIRVQFHCSLCGYSVCLVQLTFPIVYYLDICQNSNGCKYLGVFLTFLSWLISDVGVSVIMPVPCCFDYYHFRIYFEFRPCDASGFDLWKLKIAITPQGLVWFNVHSYIVLSISVKHTTGI
jgi:hypothetical protein